MVTIFGVDPLQRGNRTDHAICFGRPNRKRIGFNEPLNNKLLLISCFDISHEYLIRLQWGNEILHVLKGARIFSEYDIAPIIEQIREKQHILIENYPDEFGPHKWSFDLDEWMAEEYHSGRPTYYSKAITEKREAELRELYDKRGQTNG